MTMTSSLPSSGPAREALRVKGQFFTPDWVANSMVAFAGARLPHLYDPGFGLGAFAQAASRVFGTRLADYSGCDTDPTIWERAAEAGVSPWILRRVEERDFLAVDRLDPRASIVCNPPYIRHHRLTLTDKQLLHAKATRMLGRGLDGRAGLHAFFLLHAISLLGPGGRLAFIVPSDICEGVYAPTLWEWIARTLRIHAVISFAPDATPFPGVDTNPIVLLLSNDHPQESYVVARVESEAQRSLQAWVEAGMPLDGASEGIAVEKKSVRAGLRDGISRFSLQDRDQHGLVLGDVVKVLRGIATGANEFFFLTSDQLKAHGLPRELFVRAVGRTRDVCGDRVTSVDLERLDEEGRPTWLLNLDVTPPEGFEPAVRAYLERGVEMGLPLLSLIRQRKPWYKMERRRIPTHLFAYLGRRSARFIQNEAGVVPLTSFLCIYPRGELDCSIDQIVSLLSDPGIGEGFHHVAKSYGGGAIKLEPRSLERAPLMPSLVARHEWLQELRDARKAVLSLL